MRKKVLLALQGNNKVEIANFIETFITETGFELEEVESMGNGEDYVFEYIGDDVEECIEVLGEYESEPLEELWGITSYSIIILEDVSEEIPTGIMAPEMEDGELRFVPFNPEEE